LVGLSFEHERIPQYRPCQFPDEHTELLKRTYLDALEHLVDLRQDLSGFLGHIGGGEDG